MTTASDGLLGRLGALSSYGTLDGPTAAAAAGRPLHDPRPLVDHVGAHLGTADPMVAASVAFQAVTSRVAVPVVLSNEVLGRSLATPFSALRWRVVDGQVRLGLVEVADGAPLAWADLVDGLVRHTFEPWVAAMRSHVRIARRLLWGNAADSLVGAAKQAAERRGAGSDLAAMAKVVLEAMPVPNLMTVDDGLRRTTCCLIDKAPGYGRCAQCSLRGVTLGVRPLAGRRRSTVGNLTASRGVRSTPSADR